MTPSKSKTGFKDVVAVAVGDGGQADDFGGAAAT